ncbi:hypothetical protein O5O45_08900 [Hahella aquimaris]|uniref:magnesium transporter MgtE N-terminal domain-containing protein n=1 Tax=Hahella sp. HNIBRBA332 TaxID=3015983 RepID=UPI00273CA7E3|nr:hypothetical protein [Hahella sp. HNIBRBA332]WLQ16030.1 hypothetical protein O5O45_08900 [Hahella sp. HNIBRBA332]
MTDQTYQLAFSFLRQEPRAAARFLEDRDREEVAQFLANAPLPVVISVLKEMLPRFCATVIHAAPESSATLWTAEMGAHQLCNILRHLPPKHRETVLNLLPLTRRTLCQQLLSYSNSMLGAWTEIDVPVFTRDMTVEDAMTRLKKREYQEERIIVVLDQHRGPLGAIPAIKLLRSPRQVILGALVKSTLVSLNSRLSLSNAASHPLWTTQDFAPVVFHHNEFMGVIWHSRLRELLSTHSDWLASPQKTSGSAALDLLRAHGESMQAMVEVVRESLV